MPASPSARASTRPPRAACSRSGRLAARRRLRRVLDLGCGSGILAIAAAKLGAARVIAADNDPIAVAVARENAARNRVGHRIRGVVSEGYRDPLLRAFGPYDLILANILADPLCALARATARHLAPGGIAVLSGLLDRQAPRVVAAHRPARLRLKDQITLGIWTTLIMAKRPVARASRPVRRPPRDPADRNPALRRLDGGRHAYTNNLPVS